MSAPGNQLSAVLLAGGESRRMGRDKAEILFHGEPLWSVQIGLLRALKPFELLVSARKDPSWRPPDACFVPDASPSRGPLGGLAASLGQMRGTHLLALAIDMPFMTHECLLSICREIEPSRGVLPMIGSRAEPLAAIYPREALPDFEAAMCGNDYSLQRLTRQLVNAGKLGVLRVASQEKHRYRSLNEPADLSNLGSR
jgi:molybdenum cofactor guanylyltransferase